MDKRRIETGMQLGDGIADAGEQSFRHVERRAGLIHLIGERAPGHELHDHRILLP